MIDPFLLTSHIASKVCHDLIAPMGVISQTLELLDMPLDASARQEYETLLKETVQSTAARLPFLRFVFGTQGLADNPADIGGLKKVAMDYAAIYNPKGAWNLQTDELSYAHMRMLLLLMLIGIDGMYWGGNLSVNASKTEDGRFDLSVTGTSDRVHYRDELLSALKGEMPKDGWLAKDIHPEFARVIAKRFGTTLDVEIGPKTLALRIPRVPARSPA